MAIVYLDTSFFTALIENQAGRQEEARRILRYETGKKSHLFTSLLTDNEFLIKYHERFKDDENREGRLDEIIVQLRAIATPYAITEGIVRKAAEIQCAWRQIRRQLPREDPRDKRFRWDAIHLATADTLNAVRVYAWDHKWMHLPGELVPGIGEIISPAVCPQPDLAGSNEV